MNITKNLLTAVLMTIVTTLLLGVAYPLVVTGLAQMVFPGKANGQLIERHGKIVGRRHRLRRGELRRDEPGADQQEAHRRSEGGGGCGEEGEPVRAGASRSRDEFRV